ncbi:MAG: transcriptional regulator, partial [Anaerocolumna sp.]|nr:transcriptional regulator [Anaerocolumna sp.]
KENGVDEFNGAQGKILYVLWENKDITISEISKLTSLANTTLTSMLDRMETQGLIVRTHNSLNRRQIIISTTKKAEELKGAFDKVSEQVNKTFYSGFSNDEITFFENTLRRIIENLK